MTRLIDGAGANGNSRATLPLVAKPAGREVGAPSGQSDSSTDRPALATVGPENLVRLRQSDAAAFHIRRERSVDQLAAEIEKTTGRSAGETVAMDQEVERDFSAAEKGVRCTISGYLDKLAFDAVALFNPDPFAITVTRAGIAGVGVGLLHRAVGIEDIHVILERC